MNPRADAEDIFRAAVASVDPEALVERAVRVEGDTLVVRGESAEVRYDLRSVDRIVATGMGKASARMAVGLERALEGRLAGGLVVVKAGPGAAGRLPASSRLRLVEASHPVPDDSSVAAARAVLGLGAELTPRGFTPRDLVIVLVSGGGSSLLCAPAEGLSLDDKIGATRLLLSCGATINEVNCVRKHLSAVKGGRLAAALGPASVLSLVLSDVVGDDLDAIASGPTVPDGTSFADALAVVRRYRLEPRFPAAALARLEAGASGGPATPAETPKPGDPAFARTRTVLVGTNRAALAAAEARARELGYGTLVLSSRLTGEARELALAFLGIGKDMAAGGFPLARPACLIAGGESTVTIRGSGSGGRNQEMALAFLAALGRSPRDGEGLTFLSAGTDGGDGPTDAAGAVVDLALYGSARAAGLDPEAALADNDSYGFFERSGGHVMTGPTGTNVCDVQVLLAT